MRGVILNMSNTKFSLVVPIFNTEQYLRRCLDSIVNQTYKDIEILLINDGSTDSSPVICDEYKSNDVRIRVINKENGGLSDARNVGIRNATGDYIMFVDSDDYIALDSCDVFCNIIEANPKIDIIASNSKMTQGNLKIYEMYHLVNVGKVVSGCDFLKLQLKTKKMRMSSPRNLYNRHFLLENRIFFKEGLIHEDEHWTPRAFLLAKSVVTTDFVHYLNIARNNSLSRNEHQIKNAEHLISICCELEKTYAQLPDQELRSLAIDYLVKLYFTAIMRGKLYKRSSRHLLKKDFIKGKACTRRTKVQAFLYSIDIRLFYFCEYYFRKIKDFFLLLNSPAN